MLYCIINSYGEIIGRFKTYEKAIDYLFDCWIYGMGNVKIKKMTKEEYLKYTKFLIDNT